MKRLLKWALLALSILLLLIAILASWINFTALKTYPNKAENITINVDSSGIAEGKRLTTMLCMQCHKSDEGKLGGALMEDGPFGKVYSKNITQHPEYGIANYTDGELVYLLRTGITKDGAYTPPWMLKTPNMSDEDINNIIAFLRSDDPLVQPSSNVPPPPEYSFLSKALIKLGVFGPLPYPEEKIVAPDPKEEILFGKYLVDAKFDCYGCHASDFKSLDILKPENSPGYFGGGNPFENPEGGVIYSANLTFDKKTGIGNWSEDDFVKALRTGVKPDNTMVQPPMTPYALITEEEAKAIYAYLQSIPIIHNEKLIASK